MEQDIVDLISYGCDLDGDIINGEYHHVINEARQEGMSVSDMLKHIEQKGRK